MKFINPWLLTIAWTTLSLSGVVAQTVLVAPGSVWKYLDTGTNLGTTWRASDFNDSSWPSGAAELGYGDDADGRPETTRISYGTNANNKFITYYFRRSFDVPDASVYTNLILGALRDDGIVVYLNGAEVWRDNMPAGTISFTTLASSAVAGVDEATFIRTNLSPAKLRTGTNLVAVEVHQSSATSSDVGFDLFLAGFTQEPLTGPLMFYVATSGNDDWSGTLPQPNGSDGPFATLERARNAIRFYSQNNVLPEGGAVVEVAGGVYPLARSLDLSASDTGQPGKPIVYRARTGEEVRLIGGRVITGFSLVTDAAVLSRLDESARGKVWQCDLRAQGLTNFPNLQGGTGWAQSDPGMELFFQDRPMTLARWPNKGYIKMIDVLGPTPVNVRGTVGCVEGIFTYEGDRPTRWLGEPNLMVHGYWFWDWADQRHNVLSVDATNRIITVAQPYHTYGYRKGQWFYAFNILSELDQPGEWYLDRQAGLLYFWPPAPLDQGTAMVSLLPGVLTMTNVSSITFRGFIFEGAQGTGISISGGSTNCLQACTVRNMGKTGIRISNSPGSGVTGCEVYFLGDGGVTLSGGDRRTLTPAGMYADHNHIHHWSRWNPVYKQGVSLGGVGNRATHNLIHDAPHEAIGFGGNDHLIEFNEIHSVVKESNDAGVMYAGRTWTARGHMIRYNYMHHIYGFERRGCNGVYLDDQFSSATVYGNIFYEMPTAILIGGGRDNYVLNNVFVKCKRSISIDARGLGWASNTVTTLTNDLNSWPYQSPPWSDRYPQLPSILNEDPMAPRGNVVAQNICWNSGWTSIETKAQPGVTLSNNLLNTDPLFVDTNRLNFQLHNESPAFPLGFERIPIDQIGPDPSVPHAPWQTSVSLVQPVDGGSYGSRPGIPFEALVSDPGGANRPGEPSTAVDLFIGNALLQSLTEFPFQFTWQDAPSGEFILTAQARLPDGLSTTLDALSIQVNDMLVPTGSIWKYLDNGSNQGTGWRALAFNDSAWLSGPAELGYGDDTESRPEATQLSFGANSSNKYITYYFRHAFAVRDPSSYTNLILNLLRDDGAIVYLNGTEIWRDNMTDGAINYTTLALTAVSGTGETTYYQTNLPSQWLIEGTNLLAVEIHQATANSSDISFDLSLVGQSRPPLPVLTARPNDAILTLTWPLVASDYLLQSTSTLPPIWEAVNCPLQVTNAAVQALLTASTSARFFRLLRP